jgi:hypothetical protein
MERIMAVVEGGIVTNIIIADDTTPVQHGTELVEIKENQFVTMGFTWDGQNFLNHDGNPVLYDE